MNSEIEVKFPNVDHETIRQLLRRLGAECEYENRLMKRVVIHSKEMSTKDAFIRVRDEGYRTTVTYKQFDRDTVDGAKEYEVIVSNFDEIINIFKSGGLDYDVYQESKRENWRISDVEIMLDEWPWLKPYMEIEGPSEEKIKDVANKLGFDWSDGIFGGVANLYRLQYPHIGESGNDVINHDWKVIKFDDPAPDLLIQKF